MSIEITLLISIITICCTIYAASRNWTKDTREDQAEQTTILVKLENISAGINEIKTDMRSVKTDLQEHDRRLTRLEESAKQAHKRLDELNKTHNN